MCAALVAAFQYVGLVWSFGNFNPGNVPDFPEYLNRHPRIGNAMLIPFEHPLRWLTDGTGDSSQLVVVVRWFVLPLCYGAIIYFGIVVIRQRFSRPGGWLRLRDA